MVMKKEKVKKISPLPVYYTNVKPASFIKQPLPVEQTIPELPQYIQPFLHNQLEWLNKVCLTEEYNDSLKLTWSSHHALLANEQFEIGISSLLPLLRDQSHDVATIKHSVDKIKDATSFLNPTQSPVVTADQPLFALAKQIQWTWPIEYENFVFLLGGLHIEMASLKMIGRDLKNSG